ncbi:MAG: 23S rRNA (pseudouridine(1915)-N(3))-methyltransferase RlmH [Burkholderiales bacterium]
MKLQVISVGHKLPAWAAAGFNEYSRRMPREARLQITQLKPARREGDSAAQIAQARTEEGNRILAAIPSGSVKIALDEGGKALTTAQLARQLHAWMGEGRDLSFVIGGADGLDAEFKRTADLVLALSALTLPHALARVVLVEQLYRALSLIRNHPYHRE